MKKFTRNLTIIMVLVLSVTATGVTPWGHQNIKAAKITAKKVTTKKTKAKKKIKLNRKKAVIRVNRTLKLKLKNAKAKKVKWRSLNKKVATVSRAGRVKARKKGKTTIIAKYKGKKYRCKVTVKKAKIDAMNNVLNDIDKITLSQAVYLSDGLYKNKNENIVVSPLSLNMALGMAANGAASGALKDLEGYLGKNLAQYNQYASNQMNRAEKDDALTLANGVWYKEECTLNPAFEDAVTKYYQGEINAAPLDQTTVNDINQWTSDKTDGMIPEIIDEIDKNTVSLMLNALLFQGKWTSPFKASDVKNGKFTMFSGKQTDAKMMNGTVGVYFENDKATGFEKRYGDEGEYSFIAILPKKKGDFYLSDLDVAEFLSTKTMKYDVDIQIPKFTYSWKGSLKAVLSKTGIQSIFNPLGNPMGNLLLNYPEKLYVDDICQACKIMMDEDGTKAAAVTITEVKATSYGVQEPGKVKTVKLNRPFAYIIRDNTTKEVMFMGKVIDITQK